MKRILYLCVCGEVHYDDDYKQEDGDKLIINHKRFFKSIERVKGEISAEIGTMEKIK